MSKLSLYTAIKTALLAVTDETDQPVFKSSGIGLYKDQFGSEEKQNAYTYPCCFVQFSDLDWEQESQYGAAKSETTVTLHFGFRSFKGEPLEDDKILDYLERSYKALQFLTGDNFNALIRGEEREDTDYDQIYVWETDYRTLLHDDSAAYPNRKTRKEGFTDLTTVKD